MSEPDSSDEEEGERSRYRVEIVPALMEEAAPAPTPAPHDRRKMFAKSKSMKNCFSMPAPVGSRYCYISLLLHITPRATCPIFVVSGIIVMCFRLKYPFLARYCQVTASSGPPNICHQ